MGASPLAVCAVDAEQPVLGIPPLELAIAFGEVRYEIGAGASALAHTDRPHAYACVGRQPVRFIMVVAEWHSRKR